MSEEAQVADAPVETGQVPSEQPAQEAPKEETQAAPDWRSQIDESYRDHPSLQHYSDINGLAKSHINAQKMIGADKIVLPGKHASQEDSMSFIQNWVDRSKLRIISWQARSVREEKLIQQ